MDNSKSIKINIKPEAADKIKAQAAGQVVLLALNDGSNKYSDIGGSCTIGANFQFVILNQPDPDFPIKVDNNADLDMYTSSAELQYLDGGLIVSQKDAALSLADDSGVIDGAVTINVSKNN
ncbi:Iron-sulphur cluster biosynthesis [Lactobacillus bombicola]|uniref:Iron-sulphur cluster biosynthesis n=1 Tax=Lactobacillus bombicola TaxID=1505723 RepID=A0A1I1TSA8_9LACO|nr:iron-sulfur cluster biosynthesis family protein [Lactobacillus bombicola]MCO6528391.1 iron-sulfur cluster biosynthesis family protein [Lactobacillus sp.]SFD61462.1 Iron-sulphur cluster biosynthesis [Lactobacillus bombicola]